MLSFAKKGSFRFAKAMVIYMTYNDIFLTALTHIGETPESQGIDDYTARAPYLLSFVVASLASISKAIGTEAIRPSSPINLNHEFPLDNKLADIAALKLASLFAIHESLDISTHLAELAERQLSGVLSELTVISPIREVY